jgi:predicted methyltransferase
MTIRLTELVHQKLAEVVQPGDRVVDATLGNGHDTLVLARLVGTAGLVYGVDLQPIAVTTTRVRLADAGLTNSVLTQACHSRLAEIVPASEHGAITAIVFNLGYLPGGDHHLTTRTSSTLAALSAAKDLLKRSGLLSVMAYPGHPGGAEETAAVEQFMADLALSGYIVNHFESEPGRRTGPRLWLAERVG